MIICMKIGVSLPDELIAFADEAASQRGTTRSELVAHLLEAERVPQQTLRYLDRHVAKVRGIEALQTGN